MLIAAGAFLTDVDRFPWKSQSEFCVVRATHKFRSLGFVCSPSFFSLPATCRLFLHGVQPRSQLSSAISHMTSPVKLVGKIRAIALGSKPPLVTRIARTGLGTRLHGVIFTLALLSLRKNGVLLVV